MVAVLIVGASLVRSSPVDAVRQEPRSDNARPGSFTDYFEEATGVVTRVFPGDAQSTNILQATGSGWGRDVVARLTPIGTFEHRADDGEVPIATGDVVITQPYIRFNRDTYNISYRFHIPRDALRDEFQYLAVIPDRAAVGPVRKLFGWVAPTVFAVEADGLSGIVSETYLPGTAAPNVAGAPMGVADPDFAHWYENVYRAQVAAPEDLARKRIAEWEQRMIGQQITPDACTDPEIAAARDYVRRARELADDEARFGRLTPGEQAASGQASELAARRAAIEAELRAYARTMGSSSPSAGASASGAGAAPPAGPPPAASSGASPSSGPPSGTGARTAAGGALRVVRVGANVASGIGSALTYADIQADSERWRKRLRELRECAENPTNPVARRAMKEDPNYTRATLDRLRAAEMEESFTTNTRTVALGLNTGAGLTLKLVGGAATSVAGEVSDSLLERRMEETMTSLEECVVRCDLKRTLIVEFTWTHPEEASGCDGGQCEEWKRSTTISGTATLTLQPNGQGYEGTGEASYTFNSTGSTKGSGPGCTTTSGSETLNGAMRLEGRAYFSLENDRTGGVRTGRRDRSVLEIATTAAAIKGSATFEVCGDTKIESRELTDHQFDCHFYDVDLKAGGTFTVFKDRRVDGGTCTVTIRPQ